MTPPSTTNNANASETDKAVATAKRNTAPKKVSAKTKQTAAPKPAPVKAKRVVPSKAPKAVTPGKVAQAKKSTQAKNIQPAVVPVAKEKKVKVVRDSFTIPKNEFNLLGDMKKKALTLGLEIKKSELIRAGLLLLNSASDAAFKKALSNVPTLKTGRPGKN